MKRIKLIIMAALSVGFFYNAIAHPTGIAERNGNIYILECTNANDPATEGWIPRVRKMDRSGTVTTLADFSLTGK